MTCLVDDILTTVFPGDCRVCDGPLPFQSRSSSGQPSESRAVCRACVAQITPQRGFLCASCGESLGMESERFAVQTTTAALCSACRLAPPQFIRAVAHAVYQDELRDMVHLLKYEGLRSITPVFGRMLAGAIATLPLAPDTLVIAVPLFAARQKQRGYNQAVLLADEATRHLRQTSPTLKLKPAHTALRRTRDTESQFALTPHARRKNLRGAFTVPDLQRVAGREILLIDDIYTTGATTRECSRVLLAAGATRVWVATLARAQTEGVALWDPATSKLQPVN